MNAKYLPLSINCRAAEASSWPAIARIALHRLRGGLADQVHPVAGAAAGRHPRSPPAARPLVRHRGDAEPLGRHLVNDARMPVSSRTSGRSSPRCISSARRKRFRAAADGEPEILFAEPAAHEGAIASASPRASVAVVDAVGARPSGHVPGDRAFNDDRRRAPASTTGSR